MKITKAIEILDLGLIKGQPVLHEDLVSAATLGIEVLNHYQMYKRNELIASSFLLPGEEPE